MLPSLNSPIWCRVRKDVKIIEAEVFSFSRNLKGKSNLMIFDRHANLKYKYENKKLYWKIYYVNIVGKNKRVKIIFIINYKKGIFADQISIEEYLDSFIREEIKKK